MSTDLTPEARRLIARVEARASEWNAIATDPDDQSSFVRHGARARRDQCDEIARWLRDALPEIERQAVAIEVRTDDLLAQLIESVP